MTLAKTRTWIAQATSSKRQGAEMAKRGLLWAKSGHFAAAVLSALGQKQTFAAQNGMSALPPKADMCGARANVCFGPIADIPMDWTF
jgi:hypothetical protein